MTRVRTRACAWRRSICCAFAVVALASCRQPADDIVLSGPTMGTTYAVKVTRAPASVDAYSLRRAIEETLAHVDRLMSGYRVDSEISRFNASRTTDWVPVSRDLAAIVRIAQEVSAQSSGAFDTTVAPLVHAWGFGPTGEPAVLPDEAALAVLRGRIGYEKLQSRAEPSALRKQTPELQVDLNGVAPGYAVDLLADRLIELGVQNFMIEIGGEVRTHGRNARAEPWRIAVERPLEARPAPYAIIGLEAGAVAASGEYRRYYFRAGRRYSHTIDPRTARPVGHALAAVVVIDATAAQADAWATAMNVLGEGVGYELALKRDMAALFIVQHEGRLTHRATPRFEQRLLTRS